MYKANWTFGSFLHRQDSKTTKCYTRLISNVKDAFIPLPRVWTLLIQMLQALQVIEEVQHLHCGFSCLTILQQFILDANNEEDRP